MSKKKKKKNQIKSSEMKENLSQAKNELVNPLIWLFVDGHQDLQYIMCYLNRL